MDEISGGVKPSAGGGGETQEPGGFFAFRRDGKLNVWEIYKLHGPICRAARKRAIASAHARFSKRTARNTYKDPLSRKPRRQCRPIFALTFVSLAFRSLDWVQVIHEGLIYEKRGRGKIYEEIFSAVSSFSRWSGLLHY